MRYLHLPRTRGLRLPLWKQRSPAVVFVHGLLGYSFSWRHNLEFFASRRDVYAVDMLGVGHSDRPAPRDADYGLPAAAIRLRNFLESLGHRRIDLVATSHGGAVAMLVAALDSCVPSPLIRRLVLVAPAHPYMPDGPLPQAMLHNPYSRSLLRGLVSYSLQAQAEALGLMYADETRITPETREGYAVNFDDPATKRYATEVVMRWGQDKLVLEEALPMIARVPTLLLWGAQDQTVPAASAEPLQERFHSAELSVLPGVGHLPYEEAPEEFNGRLWNFLQD
jgi:pimeloyl-ACP methyl ester carboxylesterase